MEATTLPEAPNPSLIFLSLICLELAWNTCRSILICISVRYYLEIIKEVRQINTIRLSDFTDSAATDYEQEFHEEMMNEYPGHGHKENIFWYSFNIASCMVTVLLDVLAASSAYHQNQISLLLWLFLYLGFSICEPIAATLMMRKYTNQLYFKRKWRHCFFTFVGCTTFRLYLIWLWQDLPSQP